jgi:3-hydroxyacyl-[acyl-carrier-protein] dehydratase
VLEALAQAGGALLGSLSERRRRSGYLAGVDGFQMHSEARIGDQLRIEVELVRFFAVATLFRGVARVGDRVVADGRFTLALPR